MKMRTLKIWLKTNPSIKDTNTNFDFNLIVDDIAIDYFLYFRIILITTLTDLTSIFPTNSSLHNNGNSSSYSPYLCNFCDVAAAAMALSSISVITNSSLLKRLKIVDTDADDDRKSMMQEPFSNQLSAKPEI